MPLLPLPNEGLTRQARSLRHSASISPNPQANLSGWFEKQKALWPVRRWLELRGSTLIYSRNRHAPAQWAVDLRECTVCGGCRARELVIQKPGESTPIKLFAPTLDEFKLWFTELKRVSDNIHAFYHMAACISHVTTGPIYLARDRTTNLTVSVFAHNKQRLTPASKLAILKRDARVIRATQTHRSLLRVIDVFETINTAFVVTEVITGASLYNTLFSDVITYAPPYSIPPSTKKSSALFALPTSSISPTRVSSTEGLSSFCSARRGEFMCLKMKDVKQMARELLSGLAHLHSAGITHGTIDSDHVICTGRGIKLMTFGAAYDDHGAHRIPLHKCAVAPEIICFQHTSAKGDIFAAGVLIFKLLTGDLPFQWTGGDEELLSAISHGPCGRGWHKLPTDMKRLLGLMMQEKSEDRPSARLCLLHCWFIADDADADDSYDGSEDDTRARCWKENVEELNSWKGNPKSVIMEYEMSCVSGEGSCAIHDDDDDDDCSA